MVKKVLVLLLFIRSSIAFGETIKTDVVVVGNGTAAIAAAIQSGRSKVKTLLLLNGPWLEELSAQVMVTENRRVYTPSGIYEELDKELRNFYKKTPGYDTLAKPLRYEPYTAAATLKKMADSVKMLTVKISVSYTAIEKDDTGWKLSVLINGEKVTVKAKVLVDGTENGDLILKAGLNLPPALKAWQDRSLPDLYRTSIASGTYNIKENTDLPYATAPVYYVPLNAVVVPNAENLLTINNTLFPAGRFDVTAKIALGQGVGATAAFCAFFKTTTKKLDVRAVQIEVLDFKTTLLYFEDIDRSDAYYRAIQQIAATGMLKGIHTPAGAESAGTFNFKPDLPVTTAEIKPVLTEIYTRAFLWLNKEHPGEKFTVGNLLSLISEVTLTEPGDLKATMQKLWKQEFKFESDFDVNKAVTRREFAVLANKYLNPFARTVDIHGKTVN